LNKSYKKIKILGTGNINIKLDIEADFSSKSARERIEKLGGKISIKKA
jgi:ribosomal protein L15